MDKLTQIEKDLKIASKSKEIVDEYRQLQQVAMMALSKLVDDQEHNSVTDESNIEDARLMFESFMFKLKSIQRLMSDNMYLLWEIEDDKA